MPGLSPRRFASLLRAGSRLPYPAGSGTDNDKATAAELFTRDSECGYVDSQFDLLVNVRFWRKGDIWPTRDE